MKPVIATRFRKIWEKKEKRPTKYEKKNKN